MSRLNLDVRRALRVLTGAPGFASASLLALALGIGATTAIFSFVDAVLLKPLPFRDPGRLLLLYERNPVAKKEKLFVAPANFAAWRDRSRSLEVMAALSDTHINLTGGPNGRVEPEELKAERVSAALFQLLGVEAVVGRVFRQEEDQPGRANVAVLAYSLWQRRFGADQAISGKSIRLRDQSYVVVGVLPPGFEVKEPGVEIFLPLVLNPADPRSGRARNPLASYRNFCSFRSRTSWWATSGSRCWCCWGRSRCCSGSPAPTSPTCCWRALPAGGRKSPFAPPSAPPGWRSRSAWWAKA